MSQNIWKVVLVGIALAVAPGFGMAVAPDDVAVPEPVEIDAVQLAEIEGEVSDLINELGGTMILCIGSCPPGMTCCMAFCVLACCQIACPAGTTPRCSCDWQSGKADCYCEVPGKGPPGGDHPKGGYRTQVKMQ